MMIDLIWLGQPDAHDNTLVGGKAANLSQLAAEYSVPLGFCLTTRAFEIAHSSRLSAAQIPLPLADQIDHAYQSLAARVGVPNPRVAVRSSAVDEDGDADSFA